MGTIDQPDFPGYMRGKQGIAQAETKLSFVKPSIILYCPHLVPDASLLAGEIRSEPLPQRITQPGGAQGAPRPAPLPLAQRGCWCSRRHPAQGTGTDGGVAGAPGPVPRVPEGP